MPRRSRSSRLKHASRLLPVDILENLDNPPEPEYIKLNRLSVLDSLYTNKLSRLRQRQERRALKAASKTTIVQLNQPQRPHRFKRDCTSSLQSYTERNDLIGADPWLGDSGIGLPPETCLESWMHPNDQPLPLLEYRSQTSENPTRFICETANMPVTFNDYGLGPVEKGTITPSHAQTPGISLEDFLKMGHARSCWCGKFLAEDQGSARDSDRSDDFGFENVAIEKEDDEWILLMPTG